MIYLTVNLRINMKYQITLISGLFSLFTTSIGCKSLNYDPNSLYINQVLGGKSGMSIQLEDNSKFSIDVQNFSSDTLLLKRHNMQDVIVAKEKVSINIDSNMIADLMNKRDRNVKVQVRVYNHKSKIIYKIHDYQ
jgi:hypothetical protein